MCNSLGWPVMITITNEKGRLESEGCLMHLSTPGCSLCTPLLLHISEVLPSAVYDPGLPDVLKEGESKLQTATVHFNVRTAGLATVKHLFIITLLQNQGFFFFFFQCKFHRQRQSNPENKIQSSF